MKKRLIAALAAPLLALALSFPAVAANQVSEIAVDVTLYPDGSAYVVQEWDGSFDEGTECYFPVTNLGDITLSNLLVSDAPLGAYATLSRWDPGASFDEKARKSGLNPVDGGYEVCWGISEYGQNRYAVEYQLGGLVAAYDDADGFLFQFIPSGMNTGPTDVTVRIQTQDGTPLTTENAGIWAFGFEGQINFSDRGSVLANTEQPLTGENSVIVMLRLNKGVLTPSRTISGSFEDVKNRAFEGSDYGEDESSGTIWLIAIGAIIVGVVALIWIGGKEGRRVKKLEKSAGYWREAPVGGNLEASFVLARRFYQADDDGAIIAATLVKLVAVGSLVPLTEMDVGFLGREKEAVSLRLANPPTFRSSTAAQLYSLLEKAAGSDGILQEKELEHYCKTNYQALLSVVKEAQRDGGETLAAVDCYKSRLITDTLAGLTDRGMQLLLQLIGYKKYLLDFSLIPERGLNEGVIWQDCLTYAALLGIADRVMEQLRKLYPTVNTTMQSAEMTYYVAYRYNRVTYTAAKNAASAAQRTAGGGGSSSFRGGSGFSGGGRGGGTR